VSAMTAQQAIDTPESFRDVVDLQTSLANLDAATEDMELLETLAERVLVLDGTVNAITVYSEEADDFYVEMEIVSGRWSGVESVKVFRAYVFFDDPVFAGKMAERPPRQADPSLILRNTRVLVAGQLVSLAEDPEGRPVPVIHGYDVRPVR
jgi:hypothetical protein